MNKTDQQKNNTYINYWTKSGKAQSELNNSLKIKQIISYTILDKNGNEIQRTRVTSRHPTLKDVAFKKTPSAPSLTKEEYKVKFTAEKEAKLKKLDTLPFSYLHHKLVNDTYIKPNYLKKATEESAHESKIRRALIKIRANKTAGKKRNQQDCPNLVVIRMLNGKGLPYDFSVIPSHKSMEQLFKDTLEMNDELSTIPQYFGTELWFKEDYARKPLGTARYTFYHDKKKQAA